MPTFFYKDSALTCGKLKLFDIASVYGTPTYVYSQNKIAEQIQAFKTALGTQAHRIHYAVKANSNLSILQYFLSQNISFDIVSGGELLRVLKIGGSGDNIIFSGVGKTAEELKLGLDNNIYCFNIESTPELNLLNTIAKNQKIKARIAIRVNPDINAISHPYITTGLLTNKFGIPFDEAFELFKYAAQLSNIEIIGIACHIGSQITMVNPFREALQRVLALKKQLQSINIKLQHINMGGGLGVSYNQETVPSINEYIQTIRDELKASNTLLILEPGRSLIAEVGCLLTKILYVKETQHKKFIIIDAAMNDLIRPALYQAVHTILPTLQNPALQIKKYDVVGAVCETGDCFVKDLAFAAQANDIVAIMTTGAYGASMGSNYNTRLKPSELLLHNDTVKVIRPRETIEAILEIEAQTL